MIIIKNIILYFIQIRHTDDLPSTGTGLVYINIANESPTISPLDNGKIFKKSQIEGSRPSGRPKLRRMDHLKQYMKEHAIHREWASDIESWFKIHSEGASDIESWFMIHPEWASDIESWFKIHSEGASDIESWFMIHPEWASDIESWFKLIKKINPTQETTEM